MQRTNYAHAIFILLVTLSLLAVAAVLKITASFFIPVTVAVLISFILYPLCKTLNKIHIPWVICIFIILAIFVMFFYVIGSLLASALMTIVETYPKYEARFTTIYKTITSKMNIPFDDELSLVSNILNSFNIRSIMQELALFVSSFIMSSSKVITMISLFVVFLLLEFKTMKKKVIDAFSLNDTKNNRANKILNMATNTILEVSHFISIKFAISLITGILVGAGTFAIGMDFPIIWGFLAFLLNFIPNFGSIISWAITSVFAILQFYPDIGKIIFIATFVLSINLILGNVVEPRWEGSNLGISPFIILVCLSFWGWMWGFVGMIIAVPITVILKIICENVDFLQPIAIIIGNGRKLEQTSEEEKQPDNTNASSK